MTTLREHLDAILFTLSEGEIDDRTALTIIRINAEKALAALNASRKVWSADEIHRVVWDAEDDA